jgi:nucleoside-diphosphate-sugar epimerase
MTTPPIALVTGAPGWLGTALVRAITLGLPDVPELSAPSPERGVRCLVQRGANLDVSKLRSIAPNIQIIEGDLTDRPSLAPLFANAEGATLFHSAAIIHPTTNRTSQFTAVNVDGVRNILDAAIGAGVRRMVHVSSNSPIGTNATQDNLFDESSPYNPYMGYGLSKKLGEEMVREAGDRGKIEAVVIRPPWFYGPGQPARQSLFFKMIRDGKGPIVGDGNNRRSMAYVDNICQGALLCERVDAAKGQVYWIADRRAYSMNEILDTVEGVMEKDFGVKCAHKRMRLPGLASKVAWLVDWMLQSVGIYQQKIHVLSEMNKTIACSIAKAERELGYDPKVDLEVGMRRSIQWMKDQGETL